jgi:hypothetical protein
MTRRNLAWRCSGLTLFAAASGLRLIDRSVTDPTLGILLGLGGFLLAIVGVVLLVQGKRVPQALRAELRRHRARGLAIRPNRRGTRPGAPGELSR